MTTETPTKLTPLQQQVLASFEEHGPMTDQQLVERTGIGMRTASPRRRQLADDGLLEVVGRATTQSGRTAQVWGLVPEERIAEVREAASKRDPRRLPVTKLPLATKLEMVRQLLDDPETHEAVQHQNGRAWRKVRGRNRDRKGQREHERRELNRMLREQQQDQTGLVDFLKTKRNLLDVAEAMRGTSEFLQEEMRHRSEDGYLRIPMRHWPEVADHLDDLEELAREAREAIDNVMGRLGDDVIDAEAIVISDLELLEGRNDSVD
jgi:predicted ArsR family transcriptional regulator